MGANENRTGVIFTATAVGSGTGKLVIAIETGAFSNVGGISSEEITVNGGAFVSEIFSHSPPELLPGITYDAVNIKFIDQYNNGFRIFVDMNQNRTVTAINANLVAMSANVSGLLQIPVVQNDINVTSLSQALNITDANIVVSNGSVLPEPISANDPGIIYVNGERIEYFVRDGNVLSNLRRSAGGTGALLIHPAGSIVEGGNTPDTLPTLD